MELLGAMEVKEVKVIPAQLDLRENQVKLERLERRVRKESQVNGGLRDLLDPEALMGRMALRESGVNQEFQEASVLREIRVFREIQSKVT